VATPLFLGPEDLKNLHRHYINLTCVDSGEPAKASNGGLPVRYNFSAFVVEVEGVHLAITAGHVFEDLKQAQAAGAILSNWAIDDSMVRDHGLPVYPIDLDMNKNIFFYHKGGVDFGVYVLSDLASSALAMHGIVPIRQEHWDAQDLEEFPFWTLVGQPTGFATLRPDGTSSKCHVTVQLTPLAQRPEGLQPTQYPRLFARIEFASVAQHEQRFDIGGMSGGPVFATRQPPQGSAYEYRLIGIQSAWDQRKNVAVCEVRPLLRALALVMQARPQFEGAAVL